MIDRKSDKTHPRPERLQARRDPLASDQRRPVHLITSVSARTKHVLVRHVHSRHRHVMVLGKLPDVSSESGSVQGRAGIPNVLVDV